MVKILQPLVQAERDGTPGMMAFMGAKEPKKK
jgi:hypothetical protein